MGRAPRRISIGLALAATLASAACGTTVSTTGSSTSSVSGSLTAPNPGASAVGGSGAPGAITGTTGITGTTTGGTVGGVGSSAATTTGYSGATSTAAGGPAGLVPAAAPGVTAKNVFIGIPYSSQGAAGDKEIGAAGAAPSYDERDVFNAVITYANAHGGFAGRQLQALYYDFNLTDDASTQDQSACAHWTQDNKVFSIYTATETILDACMEKEGGIPIGQGPITTYQQFPHLVNPDDTRLDRLGAVTVNGLYRAHYFTGKLGLVTWDDPLYRYTIAHGYLPALQSHGLTPTQTAYISVPQQIGALGDMTAAVSSTITKFRSLGIDHVIIQDGPAGVWSGTGLTFEWMNQADSQHYYPRYGQNAENSPGWDVLPADQMDHALAINDVDVDPKFDVGWHTNRARQLCFTIQAKAGLPVSSSNENDEGIAAVACDIVFFLQRTLNSLSFVNADNFIRAVAGFNTSFQSALIYGTKMFPGRRDGGDMMRTEEYYASCKCLKFQGQPYWAD